MTDIHLPEIRARFGADPGTATRAVILVHGRGDSAEGILGLAPYLRQEGTAFVAPEAADNVWYPETFMAPPEANEPYLSSALNVIGGIVAELTAAGIPPERTVLLGFSQGACLVSEYAARSPRRYGGVAVLSGGLFGAPGELPAHAGSLADTPVFVGCSDVDFYIPVERVRETAAAFKSMKADVTERIYPGFGHSVNVDEIEQVNAILDGLSNEGVSR